MHAQVCRVLFDVNRFALVWAGAQHLPLQSYHIPEGVLSRVRSCNDVVWPRQSASRLLAAQRDRV